jgi:uncharacterized protein with GYD domain
MSHYVILWNFTDQGIKNRKDCLQSVEILKGYVERMGNPFHGTFYSFGQYDAVSLLEADNDNDVRYALLQAERQGNLRPTTLKSVTHEGAVRLAESI